MNALPDAIEKSSRIIKKQKIGWFNISEHAYQMLQFREGWAKGFLWFNHYI